MAHESSLHRSLKDGTSLDASELVCTVDEQTNVPTTSGHPRNEVRLRNLWHRSTYVIVRHRDPHQTTKGEEGDARILVQRRSSRKDYCPGKLDPAPGGVVSFDETCDDNAVREMQEEMGIPVTLLDEDPTTITTAPLSSTTHVSPMKRLVSFRYEDAVVRCWGELYEVIFSGDISELTLQTEEVDEVLSMPMSEVRSMAFTSPKEWTPDGLYALRLYLQRTEDLRLQRRLFPGISGSDPDNYRLRPRPKVIFFDCDDCLYFDNWTVAKNLTRKIAEWFAKAGLPNGTSYKMYKKYGTALKGLLTEGWIEDTPEALDAYLAEVHDLPIHSLLKKDPALQQILADMDPSIPKYVFTASVRHHAERCLNALGIRHFFKEIIDVKDCQGETKHSRSSFEVAMRIAQTNDPESCLFFDDSVKNIKMGSEMGWRSILVGRISRDTGEVVSCENAELELNRIHEIKDYFPELFEIESS